MTDHVSHWDCWGFHGELEHVNRAHAEHHA